MMTFSKAELVQVIQKNRDEHRGIFEEAVDGYRQKVVGELEAYVERVKRGDLVRVYVSFPEPSDHTRDYDRLLKMLAMSVDTDVELTEGQFAQYVLDDWDWKRQFIQTNSAYSATALSQLNEER